MRQKISPPLYNPKAAPAPQPPPPPQPVRLSRRQRVAARVKRLRDRARPLVQVGLGIFITLAALLIYQALTPSTHLTKNDVNALVASAMASATPEPSRASLVYQAIAPSVVQIKSSTLSVDGKTENGSGTGVIIDQSGAILTALHVVTNSIDIQVLFFDNTEAQASIIGQDPANDTALLRPRDLPSQVIPATLGGGVNVGDEAYVVGNPFGLRHTLTAGVISAIGRGITNPKTGQSMQNLIQFDAAVNPGNSGGPLLDRNGEVVGIVTSLLNPTDQEVFIGIGFAVPIATAGGAGGPPPY
jgi:S1-C subfamily serine protease